VPGTFAKYRNSRRALRPRVCAGERYLAVRVRTRRMTTAAKSRIRRKEKRR